MIKKEDIKPNRLGHRTRFLDTYDFVCVDCGATDGPGDYRLYKPCKKAMTRERKEIWIVRLILLGISASLASMYFSLVNR